MVPPLMAAVVHLPLAADPTQVAAVPGGAILLNESSGNREPDDLAGDDRHSIKLVETCDQSRETQGPVGLFWVHRVPCRHRSYKLVDGISNQLSHVNTHLCQDGIHQVTLRQRQIGVVVTG